MNEFGDLSTKELIEHLSLLSENFSVVNDVEFYAGIFELSKRVDFACWKDVLILSSISSFLIIIYAFWGLLDVFPVYSLPFICYFLLCILPSIALTLLSFYKWYYVLRLNSQLVDLLFYKRNSTREELAKLHKERKDKKDVE